MALDLDELADKIADRLEKRKLTSRRDKEEKPEGKKMSKGEKGILLGLLKKKKAA